MILHTPPYTENLLENTAWQNSQDFLKAVEHASVCISLLQLIDDGVMAVWIVDAAMLAVQLHIILVFKLIALQADEFQRDVQQKIDAAIIVLDRVGEVRPVPKMLSFGLKLAMTRIARIGTYFDDGEFN
jgi:hypothetical protein